jgi:hypothetical protein
VHTWERAYIKNGLLVTIKMMTGVFFFGANVVNGARFKEQAENLLWDLCFAGHSISSFIPLWSAEARRYPFGQ